MAASTGSFSYGDGSNRESLWDQIMDLDPTDTYVTSHSGSETISNKVHSWVNDPFVQQTTQTGTVELTDTTYAAVNPTLLQNTTQIIEFGVRVGATSENIDHAGFSNKFAREQLKAMKQWKQQLELSVVAGALVSGTGTAARKMNGIFTFASLLASTHASGVSLTSDLLNTFLEDAYLNGGDHDTVLVGSALKTRISSFTAGNTRNVEAKAAELIGRIDVYDSDNGRVQIVKSRFIDKTGAAVTAGGCHNIGTYISDYVKVGKLDDVHYEDRAKTGYFKSGAVVGEATAIVGNVNAVQIHQLIK